MAGLKILIAEDQLLDSENISDLIKSSVLKNYELIVCGRAVKRLTGTNVKVAVEEIEGMQSLDLALVDLSFDDEFGESSIGGDTIIRKLHQRHPHCIVIVLTRHVGAVIEQPTYTLHTITYPVIPKNADIKKKLQIFNAALMKWTQKFLRNLSSEQRASIRTALQSNTTVPALNIEGVVWKNDDYLFLYPSVLDQNEVLYLVGIDLTLAASECFGVDGVKQATHPLSQQYYVGKDGWHQKAISQVDVLNKVIEEGVTILSNRESPVNLSYLETYRENLKEFKKALEKTDNNTSPPISNLQMVVRESFRFGTSPNSSPIEFDSINVVARLSGNHFEIYLPIHLIYKSEFDSLSKKCNRVKVHSWQTKEPHNRTIKTWGNEKEPKLHREYLIFEQDGTDDYSDNVPMITLPDYFDVFRSRGFELFGRLYLVLRRRGKLKLFDCTYSPCIKPDITIFDNTLRNHLEREKSNVKAFFIFEIFGWRQP